MATLAPSFGLLINYQLELYLLLLIIINLTKINSWINYIYIYINYDLYCISILILLIDLKFK